MYYVAMRLVVGVGAPSYIVESALSAVFRAYELVGGPNVEVVVVHSGFKRAERTAGFIENLLREGGC
ncbi:hypothetical protein [Vulcanisaeta distributa]|uniref:hypothetical protein n=1 Tax=Vulcanisaeta distributa TaxID=164451 RepID=UPI0006D1A814|nr:hypothetical protein [Vulcanisaeta distributa]